MTQQLEPDEGLVPLSDRYLTPKEFAPLVSRSRQWVYQAVEDGRVQAARFGSGILIPKTEVARIRADIERQLREGVDDGPARRTARR